MRRFRFRLAPLLRLRAQFERTSRRELAVAIGALATVEQRLAAAAQGLRECSEQGARPDAVGQLAKALENGLRRHQWRLQKQQKDATQKVDFARADYAQKARDLRTLRRLREQKRSTWQLETQRAEQAELDELAAMARGATVANLEGDVR
jgi:flagellar export protein FliJ